MQIQNARHLHTEKNGFDNASQKRTDLTMQAAHAPPQTHTHAQKKNRASVDREEAEGWVQNPVRKHTGILGRKNSFAKLS